jgi:hypothetical protein
MGRMMMCIFMVRSELDEGGRHWVTVLIIHHGQFQG